MKEKDVDEEKKLQIRQRYQKHVTYLMNRRKELGITQQDIADACCVTKNYISAVERGINICSAEILLAYEDKLGLHTQTKSSEITEFENLTDDEKKKLLEVAKIILKK